METTAYNVRVPYGHPLAGRPEVETDLTIGEPTIDLYIGGSIAATWDYRDVADQRPELVHLADLAGFRLSAETRRQVIYDEAGPMAARLGKIELPSHPGIQYSSCDRLSLPIPIYRAPAGTDMMDVLDDIIHKHPSTTACAVLCNGLTLIHAPSRVNRYIARCIHDDDVDLRGPGLRPITNESMEFWGCEVDVTFLLTKRKPGYIWRSIGQAVNVTR